SVTVGSVTMLIAVPSASAVSSAGVTSWLAATVRPCALRNSPTVRADVVYSTGSTGAGTDPVAANVRLTFAAAADVADRTAACVAAGAGCRDSVTVCSVAAETDRPSSGTAADAGSD